MLYRKFFKRALDLLISLVALPFLLPVALITAAAVFLEDHGPVFYVAERLGLHGVLFRMYKFRSMKVAAKDIRNQDGTTYNSLTDERVTKVGRIIRKWSIDELPQLINVLKGEMSIVGPRPDMPDAVNLYKGNDSLRLSVKPGITGYSQALHRNDIGLAERNREDVYYVENQSLLLDARIILKTAGTVLFRRGVYRVK